jgi:uncharacterized membrane protein YtjA (UPF0391 family)
MLETILIFVIIIGLVSWLLGYLPIAEPFRTIAYVILVIIAIVYLIHFLPGTF